MQALIADELALEAREGLEALGLTLDYQPGLTVDSLPRAVGRCEILIVSGTAVTRRTLDKAPQLDLVVRAGAGVEGIDTDAAGAQGVFVTHCPGFDASARAEHAVGALVVLDRARSGGALGLRGRSLGLYGYTTTAERLARAASGLGMAVRVFAPEMTTSLASEAGLLLANDPEELFRRCDFVSVHAGAPVGKAELARLRDGGVVLAVEGTAAIDLVALRDEVAAGRLLASVDAPAVGADDEGLEALAALGGASVTRGEAGKTAEADRTAGAEVVRTVHDFLHDGAVRNAVNVGLPADAAAATLIVRHRHDMAGLVAVFDVLREEDIKALEMGNTLFAGATAGALHLRLDKVPSPAALERIRRHQSVRNVHLAE